MIKILFLGETWKGSSARSLREGIEKIDEVIIEDIGEDNYSPRRKSMILRGISRLINFLQINELEKDILEKIDTFKPDVLLAYKGRSLRSSFLTKIKSNKLLLVNVFPDLSPHLHGKELHVAMGTYDLVISTKPFHPTYWKSVYGYSNKCDFVPHGYDPAVHYWSDPPSNQDLDVILAASWRPEYHSLMLDFATALGATPINVVLSGPGWREKAADFPDNWRYDGPFYGRDYCKWLRRGKIVIAPVHTTVIIGGVRQPGDQDTTRSYELAAAGCFFVHRRTPYIQTVYDELNEVPMWDDAHELVELVNKYLPLELVRAQMARKAHKRAVPLYSIPNRAQDIFFKIKQQMDSRGRAND